MRAKNCAQHLLLPPGASGARASPVGRLRRIEAIRSARVTFCFPFSF
jgi:hypothetical protein